MPITAPVRVSPSFPPPARAIPKSVTFTWPGGRDEHVAGLHVAVHHAVLVRERERGGDVGADVGDLARRDGALVWIMSRSVWPSMYSMTMNDVPCSWPQS